jgi:FkbM family methyltransferase
MAIRTDISPSGGQLNILYNVADELIGSKNIKTIFEFGSRYGEDTAEFAIKYPGATVYAFECNPKSLAVLKEKIRPYSNIIFNENAISDTNETISFYQIDENKTKTTWADGNQGASSIFKASGKYPIEEYHQNKIEVKAVSLFSFMSENIVPGIDILWMDIQGAELKALKGLADKSAVTKIVHLEVEFIEIYDGQPLFKDINKYFIQHNFFLLGFTSRTNYSGDAIYVNRNYFTQVQIDTAFSLIPVQKKNLQFFLSKLFFKLKYFIFRIKHLIAR